MKLVLATAVITIALFGSCSSDDPSTATPSPVGDRTPEPTLDPPEASLDVEVANGEVLGGMERKTIELGETIGIAVRSDEADTVRIQSVDQEREISEGGGIYVPFTPTKRGTFTVSLVEQDITLAEIEVR